jgi:hypothetical protein
VISWRQEGARSPLHRFVHQNPRAASLRRLDNPSFGGVTSLADGILGGRSHARSEGFSDFGSSGDDTKNVLDGGVWG